MRKTTTGLPPPARLTVESVRSRQTRPAPTKQPKRITKNRSTGSPKRPRKNPSAPRPLLLAILFEQTGEPLCRQCAALAAQADRRGMDSLFLIDDSDVFHDLRARSLLFEYFPPSRIRRLARPDLQWDLYRRRRAGILYEKWRPATILPIGPEARAFAAHMPIPLAQHGDKRSRRRSIKQLLRMFQ